MTDEPEYLQKRIVYETPAMTKVGVTKDLPYKVVDGAPLALDLYHPVAREAGQRFPALVFVHGEAPPEELKFAKEWGQYISWGQLAAASGMVGITFTHRPSHWFQRMQDVADDVTDLLHTVQNHADAWQIDPTRIGIWVCSGGTPPTFYALLQARAAYLRCLIVCYGRLNLQNMSERFTPRIPDAILEQFSPVAQITDQAPAQLPPMLIVRCGADQVAGVNESIDQFVTTALAKNMALEVINHAQGQHAFDLLDSNEQSRQVIRRMIAFAQEHLLPL